MFPVTLEFKGDAILTVLPPCYGFLKAGNWSGSGDGYYDEDDDAYYDDDTVTYEAVEGSWHMEFQRYMNGPYQNSISRESRSIDEFCLGNRYDLSDLKIIWNSGTHYPLLGIAGDQTYAQLYGDNMPLTLEKDFKPVKDNVALWAEENGSDLTARAVMEMFEKFIDKDDPTCLVWHKDGFMGVDATAEADRCLFYLMLNRAIHTSYEKDAIFQMMNEIQNGCTPMQALLISRLVCEGENFMTGAKTVNWTGNDYDSCILPMSLITVGMGRRFAEPVQVKWRQAQYTHSDGHKRDDDYPSVRLVSEGIDLGVNNSMFMPLLHPEASEYDYTLRSRTDNIINAVPISVAFVKEVSKNEATVNGILFHGRVTNHPSTHRIMSTFMHSNPDSENSQYKVRPRSEWIGIIKDLLLL